MDKKAVVEIQFNYIFIMIVGIIILTFFISVAGKYKDNAETDLANVVLEKLSAISTSGQMSSDTNTLIDINDVDLSLECDPDSCNRFGCDTEFDFANKGINSPDWMNIEPLFAPRRIKSNNLITWSLDWNHPFKITSVLYLTSPEHRYLIVHDDSTEKEKFAKQILLKLKENKHIDVEIASFSQIRSIEHRGESFTKYIFVFEPTGINIHETVKKKDKWDVMFILGGSNPMDAGLVYFSAPGSDYGVNFKKVPDYNNKLPYVGTPLLIGAIYSDNHDFYSCNLQKLIMKYKDINSIYALKTEKLHDHYFSSTDSTCLYFYNLDTQQIFKDIDTTLSDTTNLNTIATSLTTKVDDLLLKNEMALNKDCPRIF